MPLPSSASAPSSSAHISSPSSSTSTPVHEPPWSGWVETTGDALIILEAARRGLIPRVTRRLVDAERKMITSGSVFVFDEEESGIKRWTDGLFWSASRILGNFLLYRETDKRGAGHKTSRSDTTVEEIQQQQDGIRTGEANSLSRPRSETTRLGIDRQRERSLVGSLTNNEKFKHGGMVKKTFSLTINGVAQHLISYYKVEDIEEGRLRSPTSYPELASLDISPEFLDKTHFRLPPRLEIGFDGIPRYRGDADDVEPSPHVISAAMGSAPLLSEPTDIGAALSKRSVKRYEPYVQPATTKVKRRSTSGVIRGTRSQPSSPATEGPGPFSDSSYTHESGGSYTPVAPAASVAPYASAAASYAIAPQYNYQMGYAPSSTLPAPLMLPPPPVYQSPIASTTTHHPASAPIVTTPQIPAPVQSVVQQHHGPSHQQTYSPTGIDTQYYSYYQSTYGYNALPAYSHTQVHLLDSPSEKSEREEVSSVRTQSTLDMALSPIIQS